MPTQTNNDRKRRRSGDEKGRSVPEPRRHDIVDNRHGQMDLQSSHERRRRSGGGSRSSGDSIRQLSDQSPLDLASQHLLFPSNLSNAILILRDAQLLCAAAQTGRLPVPLDISDKNLFELAAAARFGQSCQSASANAVS